MGWEQDMDMGRDRRYGDAAIESGTPIAAKVMGKMKQAARGKRIDLKSVLVGRAAAAELQKQVVTEGGTCGLPSGTCRLRLCP